MTYDPRRAIRNATKAMNRYVQKNGPSVGVVDPMYTATAMSAAPCCVLLKAITDGGPVPDDLTNLKSGAAIKDHVRSDGAVFIGAFELQGDRDSIVLVYGDKALPVQQAERLATLERPELLRRQHQWSLGPFAAKPSLTLSP